ncbi:type IX secretion system membrane protein PorP/SprF [Pedobacter sp. BS3]|uniref:PorP/SprF family type IX secretion system membrane protein n=1 Tax=Pedobacter sp. BS3 TaxID=2567937 RepID=UPI0011F03730|nr:type IX secretion system membrane protein PorP/SprF [Pedobacter sp. BS3]TZF81067.1 type IX secretion system membrane protein PorP/SprF [Pedobacter sp. BS3]
MNRLLVICLFIGTGLKALAQQDPQYSQYMFNMLVINPAYAGYKETINLSLLHRNQWTGIDGAPNTQSFIADGAFFNEKRVGLGLSLINDKIGFQRQTSAFVDYSYRLPVSDDNARLSFGLAIGVTEYVLNARQAVVDEADDPNFTNGHQTYFSPDAKFGVFYNNDRFYVQGSVVNLLSHAINYRDGSNNTIARQGRHYFLGAGYLADIGDDVKFKPSLLIREDTKSPTNIDVSTFFLLKETVWLGASYRAGVNLWKKSNLNVANFQQNSLVGALEVFVAKNLRLGYAYDYSLSALTNYSNGTHEISVGFTLNGKKAGTALLTPRYF